MDIEYKKTKDNYYKAIEVKKKIRLEMAVCSEVIEKYNVTMKKLNNFSKRVNASLLVGSLCFWGTIGFNLDLLSLIIVLLSVGASGLNYLNLRKNIKENVKYKEILELNLAKLDKEYRKMCIKEKRLKIELDYLADSIVEYEIVDNVIYLENLLMKKSKLELDYERLSNRINNQEEPKKKSFSKKTFLNKS